MVGIREPAQKVADLWRTAAPVGLPQASELLRRGIVAPCRQWRLVKDLQGAVLGRDGELLKSRGGRAAASLLLQLLQALCRLLRIEALRDKGGVDRGVEALEGGELRELSGVPR